MAPNPIVTPRADPETICITYTITAATTTYTTTLLLGNPLPTPTPSPPQSTPLPETSPPVVTNHVVLAATIGTLFGFIALLILVRLWIGCCIYEYGQHDWKNRDPRRIDVDGIVYVRNPDGIPVRASRKDRTATVQAVRNAETGMFEFRRPIVKLGGVVNGHKGRGGVGKGRSGTETSNSSDSKGFVD